MTTQALDTPEVKRRTFAHIRIVEAFKGPARRRWLEDHMLEMAEPGARTFVVSCDFDLEGPWAGVKELILHLLPDIQSRRPDLIRAHDLELINTLPQLRKSILPRNLTLTDVASEQEKVRSYAADRAFRNAHGLIDLLDSWKCEAAPGAPWIIACDDYDNAGTMTRYFFHELMRRRAIRLNLSLLIAVDPGNGKDISATFDVGQPTNVIELDLAKEMPVIHGREAAAILAVQLEERIDQDPIEKELQFHKLISLWKTAGRYDQVIRLRQFGAIVYLHAGIYADALRCSRGLLEMCAEYAPDDETLHRDIVMKMLNGLMGLQDSGAALGLIETGVSTQIERAPMPWRVDMFYLIAMVYARYLKPRNFAKGEEYLDRGLDALEQADLTEEQYHFHYVFNRNGLAMIRSFQHRAQDAIDLCQSGIARLNAYVGAEKHRLHRSVLIYNIAQVYLAIGRYEEAVKYYSAAIAIDPNYSEYYNERGSVLLQMNRLEEARSDYCKAIELSPPYYEVFTNLGQCYRNMENHAQAIDAYSRAIDLEPNQLLALLGRAQAYENLGNRVAAIADYTSAVSCDASQWEALANRGVLYYEAGNLMAALADFNVAIDLSPDQVSLHQNRAIVLADLGRYCEAAADLETALSCNPPEDDRLLLQGQLKTLREMVLPESSQRAREIVG